MSKRIIKFTKQKIFYSDNSYVTLFQTNFPKEDLSFKSEGPYKQFFWEVEIISYDKVTKSLSVTVSDYNPDGNNRFNEQVGIGIINKITFQELEWEKLERFLASYKREAIWPLIADKSKSDYNKKMSKAFIDNPVYNKNDTIESSKGIDNDKHIITNENDNKAYLTRKYLEKFRFPINDAVFQKGYVSINKKFHFRRSLIELKIFNENILPEYNYIKSHFHKILKQKTLQVIAEIIINPGNKITAHAKSPEIDAITKDFIQKINQSRIRKAININYNPETKKSLFSAADLLSENDPLVQVGNILKQSEKEVIKSILSMKNIRNKRQIEYLSGSDLTDKIFITLKPNIGFLFLIKGLINIHFCWELLNSHATYLWTITNFESSEYQINTIKNIISFIEENGRIHYRNKRPPELDANVKFKYLSHKTKETKTEDSFNCWEKELLEFVK